MNLTGISRDTFLGKLLRLPLQLIPPQTVLPIMQGRLRGKKWITGAGDHGCWIGSYEYSKRIEFERAIPRGAVVFDVGAHSGFYTLLASVLVGPGGRVFAFEPLPRNQTFLLEHIRLNHVQNVTVFKVAVSDRSGTATFQEGQTSAMGRLTESGGGGLLVDTVVLDELLSSGQLPGPDCIKMDIEGGEAAALAGSREVLRRFCPTVFLATHGRTVHVACRGLLEDLGYSLRPLDGSNLDECTELLALHPDRA